MKDLPSKDVVVIGFDNCLTSSVVGVLDVFEIANMFWKYKTNQPEKFFNVRLVTANGSAIHSFNAIPISPATSIESIDRADLIVVPPVMDRIDEALTYNANVAPWLQKMHKQGSVVASICTGIAFLCEAKLLDGKTATTNPMMVSYLHERYPDTKLDLHQILIDAGSIITAGPTYAFVDLLVYLVEKFCGAEIALQCSKLLLHDKNRSTQKPYLMFSIQRPHQDDGIKSVQDWIATNHHRGLTVESVAIKFNMSPRNFIRRFRKATGESPLSFIQRIRVDIAKSKLELTKMSFEEITADVGYTDSKSFGRLFKRQTSLSPMEYRNRFSMR